MTKCLYIIFIICFSNGIFSQDLFKERIRKIVDKKTSIYIEKGIFHNGAIVNNATLTGLRSSLNKESKFERVVFDFKDNVVPKIYGHLSKMEKTLYIDFFNTTLDKESFKSIEKTTWVEKVNTYTLDKTKLSVELKLKNAASADIFYLKDPARLVIDLKK